MKKIQTRKCNLTLEKKLKGNSKIRKKKTKLENVILTNEAGHPRNGLWKVHPRKYCKYQASSKILHAKLEIVF